MRGMLRQSDIRRRIAAAMGLAALIFSDAAQAQPTPPPGEAMTAFQKVQEWVQAWEVPEDPEAIDPAGTTGACVTLRLSGTILGRATEMGTDGQSLWNATRRAMQEATQRAPVERDALRDASLLEMAGRVAIDVQIAGDLVPLLGQTFVDAGSALRPGIDGVAMRSGESLAAVFPGVMLTTGLAPASSLRAAAAQAGLGPLELDKLRADHGALAYRFQTLHLAQPRAGQEPMFLHRGGRIAPTSDVSVTGLRTLAGRIASHLQQRAWPGEEPMGMLGDYDPLKDKYEPLVASPTEQALTAFALFRFARTPGVGVANATRASRSAWRILDDFQRVADGEEEPLTQPTACAAYIVAMLEATPRPPGMAPAAAMGDAFWEQALGAVRGHCSPTGEWSESLGLGARALSAYALACVAAREGVGDEADRSRAVSGVRSLFRSTSPGELPTTLPWLGWAELMTTPGSEAVPAGEALRDIRAMLWSRQVSPTTVAPGDEDLVGGVWFSAAQNPFPTWHTLRPATFAATMFGDARLTSAEEAPAELSRLMLVMRYVSQLCVDDAEMHMLRQRDRAFGGVREAVWSSGQPVEASAAGLLAVCEVLRAVEARATAGRPGEGR